MLTISKPLSSGQIQEYHRTAYGNGKENYYTEGESIIGTYHGRLAEAWGLIGEVDPVHFARLSNGRDPHTGEQLVQHQTSREYLKPDGHRVRTMEHRGGWDLTFSAPKSASVSSLVGGDERIRTAHRESVRVALDYTERFVQARIGGNTPSETTGSWAVAIFEHDSSRPVQGVIAPQIHSHCVCWNMTCTRDGSWHALQPQELFASQRYGTSIYRAELALRLQQLGYEIERGEHGSPEIKGFSREFLTAASPRSEQIREYKAEHNLFGAEAAQIAAYQTREKKQDLPREQVLAQQLAMAEKYGNQPQQVIARAQMRGNIVEGDRLGSRFNGSATRFAIDRNIEQEATVSERQVLSDMLRHGMGWLSCKKAHLEFAKSVTDGHLIEIAARPGKAGHSYTTPEMKELESGILRRWSAGRDQHPALASDDVQKTALVSHERLNDSQRSVVMAILSNRDQIMALEGAAGTGKTTALLAVCDAAKQSGFEVEARRTASRVEYRLILLRIYDINDEVDDVAWSPVHWFAGLPASQCKRRSCV